MKREAGEGRQEEEEGEGKAMRRRVALRRYGRYVRGGGGDDEDDEHQHDNDEVNDLSG